MIVDNIKFTKDKKTGYYLSSKKINGKRIRLHRYIYEKFKGKIPKGYEVHHIDQNKENNDINNLELLLKKEHQKIHSMTLTAEERERRKNNLEQKARPEAIKWHKSKDGKIWHKEQYKKTLGNRQKEKFICIECQKEFEAYNTGKNSFCSNKCKTRYRKKSGVDNVERKCQRCGNVFIINKYSQKKYCGKC